MVVFSIAERAQLRRIVESAQTDGSWVVRFSRAEQADRAGDNAPLLRVTSELLAVLASSETRYGTRHHTIKVNWAAGLSPRSYRRLTALLHKLILLRDAAEAATSSISASSGQDWKDILADVAWVDKQIKSSSKGFAHEEFTVIPAAGVSAEIVQACLSALTTAAGYVRPLFPKLLYGEIHVNKVVSHGPTVGAAYMNNEDTIALSSHVAGDRGVHNIAHELGHRYHRKFWKDAAAKAVFMELSTRPTYETIDFDLASRAAMAQELVDYIEKRRGGFRGRYSERLALWLDEVMKTDTRQLQASISALLKTPDVEEEQRLVRLVARPAVSGVVRVQTTKVVAPPEAVTPYGATDWSENFAESFAFYVTGRLLPPRILDIMRMLS